MHLAVARARTVSQGFGARIRIRPYVRVAFLRAPPFFSFLFSPLSVLLRRLGAHNKTIGEKQMNIKTITLMDLMD